MDTLALIQIFAALIASVSASGGLVAWFQRKNRRQREADIKDQEEKRKRDEQERRTLGMTAQADAIKVIRGELVAAYEDVEKKRTALAARDTKIDEQDRKIDVMEETERRQARRIAALERWAEQAVTRLEACGITDMPPVPHPERMD